jgi:hypothetical protein
MVAVQNRVEYLKPDVAVRSPKADWKAGVAGAAFVATLSWGNMTTPPALSSLALRLQSLDKARASGNGWISYNEKGSIHNYIQSSKWGRPSQAMFNELADSDPKRLIEVIQYGDLDPSLLTFAAESLGQIENKEFKQKALNTLISLSKHSSSLVREGSIYGLANFLDTFIVKDRLNEILLSDVSAGVRSAVEDVL